MFIFVYSDFESFFRTYFALVILLSSDFCFSLLYLYPTVLSEHKKAFPAAQRERFWFVFCFIFFFMAIPHNSKCRYGERGVADAKPKAQIILDAAQVSAASGGNSEPKQGQRSQSARGFCPRSTMRVPQPDIIEHFGNADAVPQPPERCLGRKAGIMRCCQYFLKLQAIYYCLNRQIIPAWFPKRFSVSKYKLYYLTSLIQK